MSLNTFLGPVLIVAAFWVYILVRRSRDNRVLQVLLGALFSRADLLTARGMHDEADDLRMMWQSLSHVISAQSTSLKIDDVHYQAILKLSDPARLQEILSGYSGHWDAYAALMRVASRVEKRRFR